MKNNTMKNRIVTLLLAALIFCTNCTLIAGNTFGRRRSAEEKHEKIARAYRACCYGQEKELEDLLNSGIKVDEIKNNVNSTALGAAVYGKHLEAVRCLLAHKASVTEKCLAGQNSLEVALDAVGGSRPSGSFEVLHELLRYHPARGQLFNEKWVQWSVDRRSPKAVILFNAIDHVENNRQNGTAAQVFLVDRLPDPLVNLVRSYLSYRQETAGEEAQTVRLLAETRAH
jgi:hypothetical protein